jgi:hypothetical protein
VFVFVYLSSMSEFDNKDDIVAQTEGGNTEGGDASGDGVETNWNEVVTSFDDMDLKEDLLRGIYAYGFEKPSAIQQRAVKPTLTGRDVIAQAQSGERTSPALLPAPVTPCGALIHHSR